MLDTKGGGGKVGTWDGTGDSFPGSTKEERGDRIEWQPNAPSGDMVVAALMGVLYWEESVRGDNVSDGEIVTLVF